MCVCVRLTTHENENRKNSIKYLENFQFYNINFSLWESHSVRNTHRNWMERAKKIIISSITIDTSNKNLHINIENGNDDVHTLLIILGFMTNYRC